MNLPTIIIGLLVLGVFVAIVAGEVKKRKRGGCCGCDHCACAGLCHSAEPEPGEE